MKRNLIGLALAAGLLSGCTVYETPPPGAEEIAAVDPPPARVEVVPVAPAPAAVWIGGVWVRSGYHRYYWRRGYWRY